MLKISKLLVLAAASSALFSGAAMAGGAPATLGGSSSYVNFSGTDTSTTNTSSTTPLPDRIRSMLIRFGFNKPEVIAVIGPLPTTLEQYNEMYVNNANGSRDPAVRKIMRYVMGLPNFAD